jgi:AAA domain
VTGGPPDTGVSPGQVAKTTAPRLLAIWATMTRAIDIPPEAVDWLWEQRIPAGMLSLVAGRPGGGKSLFSIHLAVWASRQQFDVILSQKEDPAKQMIRPRLEAAGADLRRVHIERYSFPRDLERLDAKIRRHDIKLALLEPLAAHLDPASAGSTTRSGRSPTRLSRSARRPAARSSLATTSSSRRRSAPIHSRRSAAPAPGAPPPRGWSI